MKLSWRSTGALLAAGVVTTTFAGGCARAPLRTEASASGIRAAEAVGAPAVPRAALHLPLARAELQRAKDLAATGEAAQAASQLRRSEVDAELAVALSREARETSESEAALEQVRQLRQGRQTP